MINLTPLHHPIIQIWTIFVFVFGICAGSFFNVCIWRLPRKESVVFPPSHCPKCNHVLSWFENFPLISWICLRGRCRKCKEPITIRYLLVELLTGILFLTVWIRILSLNLPFNIFIFYVVSGFMVTSLSLLTVFIDYEHLIIPNKITYPVIIFGLISAPFIPELWLNKTPLIAFIASCSSVTISAGLLILMASIGSKILKKDAFGWGDIKFIAAIAATLGPIAAFFTLFLASIIGSITGGILILLKKKNLKSGIPFGVCLAIAAFTWILCGNEIFQEYLKVSQKLAIYFKQK